MPALQEPAVAGGLQLLDLGKWAAALTAIAAAIALVLRYARTGLRAAVRWACAADIAARDGRLEALERRQEAIEHRSQLAEERTAAALERTAERLENVAKAVEHMTRLLVKRGLTNT